MRHTQWQQKNGLPLCLLTQHFLHSGYELVPTGGFRLFDRMRFVLIATNIFHF